MTAIKKIFFTGATGLVGSGLAEMFSAHPFKIKSLFRTRQFPVKNIEWIYGDMAEPTLNLYKQLEGTEVIVHNAACLKTGTRREESDEIQKVNIDFTARLLEWAVQLNIQKIIFSSSFSVIKKKHTDLIVENAEPHPETLYAKSKYIGEQMIQEYGAKYGINYYILRLSSPVTFNLDRMHETVLKKWILQSANSETIQLHGSGSRTQDFVAVSDIAAAYLSCIENTDTNGIFNIASGNTISMTQVAQLITEKFKNKYEFTGEDTNENDRNNISIEKATKYLNYRPHYSSKSCITTLLNSIKK